MRPRALVRELARLVDENEQLGAQAAELAAALRAALAHITEQEREVEVYRAAALATAPRSGMDAPVQLRLVHGAGRQLPAGRG